MKMNLVKASHYDSGPNMTPLVDIVMVILIFLMLAGTFGAAGHFLPPTRLTGGPGPGPKVTPVPNLDVFVATLGDGSFSARVGGETFTDRAGLSTALAGKRVSHENAGTAMNEMQVMIHPRLNTRYEHVTAAYEAAIEAKWGRVGFGTAKR